VIIKYQQGIGQEEDAGKCKQKWYQWQTVQAEIYVEGLIFNPVVKKVRKSIVGKVRKYIVRKA
jgi:hypothetical protein